MLKFILNNKSFPFKTGRNMQNPGRKTLEIVKVVTLKSLVV